MTVVSILRQLVLVAGVGVLVAAALARLRLPVIAGLLLAGAVVGPYGLGFVHAVHDIEVLAEVGVVLLLFTIGLEFSLKRLARIGKLVAVGGSLQVGLTIAAVTALALAVGEPLPRGIFFGFLVALSSTAIVLRALSERQETDAPPGRIVVGALIFQDLCVVPMMLLVPVLAGTTGGSPARDAALALGKAALLVVLTFAVARLVVPRLFAWVDRARSREIFLLSVLVVCLGTAWLTSLAGLSLALGAFLAGIVLAESDYAHRALSEVLPLRDVLTSIFFMSLGMLFDVRVLFERPVSVGLLFAGILLGKTIAATLAGLAMRFPPYVALVAGIGLAQFGEFGFVLARAGAELGLISRGEERLLLGAAILTMIVTPLAVRLAPRLASGARRLRGLERLLGARHVDEIGPEEGEGLRDHVIVVGYGVAGRVLARALKASGLRYLVLELNAETVRRARASGDPVYYADVASADALLHAGALEARSIVLLVNDPDAAERAIAAARRQAPQTPVFVRTHYLQNAPRLRALGASSVVVEEVEAGIEMLATVLAHAGAPGNVVRAQVEDARHETAAGEHDGLRPRSLGNVAELADLRIESFLVLPGSPSAGRSISGLDLRAKTGALVVALRRGGVILERHDPAAPLEPGDVLFLAGSRGALRSALARLEQGGEPGAPAREG